MAWRPTFLMVTFSIALLAILLALRQVRIVSSQTLDSLDALRSPSAQKPIDVAESPTYDLKGEDVADWDIRYHMGGNSQWIPKTRGTANISIEPPEGCYVDQVHMMSRHAERYPTTNSGLKMLELYQHLQHLDVPSEGDLAFANEWEFFMTQPRQRLENLVATGPQAGTLEAFATGVKLRTRYEDLLLQAIQRNQTSFWASDSRRVIETAKNFAAGFFGIDWESSSTLHVIPETPDRGGDTLTPGRTCRKYRTDVDQYGHGYGIKKLYEWRSIYLPPIVQRLREQNPNVTWTENEVYSMQELCGFETIATGRSAWCGVFTHEEWEQFEYARDILHYYRAGPGNPYSTTMGFLYLNATSALLSAGPEASGPLFLSFVHDGDLIPLLSALDLFPQPLPLPSTHIPRTRTWRTSDLVPMGGRIILERLVCSAPRLECWDRADYGYPNHVYCNPGMETEVFVRINVNDGVVPLPRCESGPGGSCPLERFVERVGRRGKVAGDFAATCGLPEDAERGLRFLHQ